MITTKRMEIFPITNAQIQELIDNESDAEMKRAYAEMLNGCISNPTQRLWHTVWIMQLRAENKPRVGDLCFKGLGANGVVEIGYGVKPEYAGRGLATEAVIAMVEWARAQPGVTRVEAETEPDNIASQRVLQKSGFAPNGVIGKEGPRYELKLWEGIALDNMNIIIGNAIAWAKARLGTTEYFGKCLAFIEDAVEQSNQLELWGGDCAAESARMYRAAENSGEPEKGAFVFYECGGLVDGRRVEWGHCGLCVGGGDVIHAYGEVRVDNYLAVEKLAPPPTWESNRYVGWVPLTAVLAYRDK